MRGRGPRPPALLRHLEHGELTVSTRNGDKVVDVQQGEVVAVSADSITVTSRDGFEATYDVTDATHVRSGPQGGDISDIEAGDHVLVVANDDGTARLICEPPGPPPAPQQQRQQQTRPDAA